jgi:hypothetical protein
MYKFLFWVLLLTVFVGQLNGLSNGENNDKIISNRSEKSIISNVRTYLKDEIFKSFFKFFHLFHFNIAIQGFDK